MNPSVPHNIDIIDEVNQQELHYLVLRMDNSWLFWGIISLVTPYPMAKSDPIT